MFCGRMVGLKIFEVKDICDMLPFPRLEILYKVRWIGLYDSRVPCSRMVKVERYCKRHGLKAEEPEHTPSPTLPDCRKSRKR